MTLFALPNVSPSLLVLLTALGYVAATIGMKGAAMGMMLPGLALTVAGFALAFGAEVLLMRQTTLSVLYVAILGVETVLVLAFAFSLGEGFTMRQGMGAAMVMVGLAVLVV